MSPIIFLRDDDVDEESEFFLLLRTFLLREEMPIAYGVIPYSLEKALAGELLRIKQKNNTLIDLVQHGYCHKNYHDDIDKYEFGPLRTYQQQYQDIALGKNLMQQYFHHYNSSIFIPPYHGFDENTLKAVSDLGFQCFSADITDLHMPTGLLNFSAQVSLNDYADNGTPICLGAKEMLSRVYRNLLRDKTIGVLFHHKVIQTKAQWKEMKIFLLGLSKMRQEKNIQILLLSSIVKAYQHSPKGLL